MPDVASVLKSEIARIARKEIRSEVDSLRKASTQYRSHIAALKREVAALQRLVSRSSKMARRSAEEQPEGSEGARLRFRREGFAAMREKLGLSAADLGSLVGVTGQTIYAWEQGKSRPRPQQLPAIAAIRKMGKREVTAALAERQ